MKNRKRTYIVYGFRSTHEALDAEALLQDMGIDVVPIPAPASISATCGIALRVSAGESDKADRFLLNGEMEPQARLEMEDF